MSVPKNLAITFDKPALDKAKEEIILFDHQQEVIDEIDKTFEEAAPRLLAAEFPENLDVDQRIDAVVEQHFAPGTSPSHGNNEIVRQKGMGDEPRNVKSCIRDGGSYQEK